MKKWLMMLMMFSLALTAFTAAAEEDELKTSELAAALGVRWWNVEVPESDQETVMLGLCIEFADGRKEMSGTMTFPPGTMVKVFCWPTQTKEELNVVILSENGRMGTTMKNPFKDGIQTDSVRVGSNGKVGDFLLKGATSNSVWGDQNLREGEFGLKLVIQQD